MKQFAAAVGFAIALACNGDGGSEPDRLHEHVGEYALTHIGLNAVPATVFHNSTQRVEVTHGLMVLHEDRSYTETLNLTTTLSGHSPTVSTVVENGTYRTSGTQVTFTIPPQGGNASFSYTGAIGGGAIAYVADGTSFRFRKR